MSIQPRQLAEQAASRFPGPLSAAMIEELGRYVIADLYPFVVDIEKCHAMWIVTADGQEVFDWAGYYASKLIGHNHPGLSDPNYQARLLRAANNKVPNPDFLTTECLAYYRMIYGFAPQCMRNPRLEVYSVNSGAEAVENMMKYFINLYNHRHQHSKNRRFIYFEQAFHGRTVFALNVTETLDPVATRDFHGLVSGNLHVPFPAVNTSEPATENRARTLEALDTVRTMLEQARGEIVGIIVEPMQGAGGHRMAEPEFFQGLSRLAHEHEVYLGFDEVQTAGGPTGSMFMVDQLNLPHPPQAVATAKKFGAGVVYMLFPMEDKGVLDSTWGGSLSDMVRFVQEMKILEREHLVDLAAQNGEFLKQGLRELETKYPDVIHNVRGLGLYQGFSMRIPSDRSKLADLALERESLLLLPAGKASIRLRPNLSVTGSDIHLLIQKLDRLFAELEGKSELQKAGESAGGLALPG